MPTLYRQYRPRLFAEVQGQAPILETLQQGILKNRLSHAYLFFGPRGTGKTTTARLLAARINCLKAKADSAEPCLKCESCTAGTNLDLIEIDAASNRGIDDIRALREAAVSRPVKGKYKVYIIDEAHMLTAEAFAALLKTLEEPQEHVIFILATTELHKVPATIASRCQIYRFRRATPVELKTRLNILLKKEERTVEDDGLDFIISRSDGCYRDAESLLGQILTAREGTVTREHIIELLGLPSPEIVEAFLVALVNGESAPALDALEKSFAQGFDVEQFARESIITARNAALSRAKQEENIPAFARVPQAGERLPLIIRALLQALQDLAYVPQPLLALHLCVLTLCASKGTAAQASAPAAAATPVAATTLAAAVTPAATTVEAARNAWPEAIKQLREKNPVASTFLRALTPAAVEGAHLKLRAQYVLHHTFFEKPENKKILQETLSQLLETPLRVSVVLDEGGAGRSGWSSPEAASEQFDLYQAAKEVFSQPTAKAKS